MPRVPVNDLADVRCIQTGLQRKPGCGNVVGYLFRCTICSVSFSAGWELVVVAGAVCDAGACAGRVIFVSVLTNVFGRGHRV